MKYRLTQLMYQTLVDALSSKDRNGHIKTEASRQDVINYINQHFGIKGQIEDLILE